MNPPASAHVFSLPPLPIDFDRNRLVEELLSLGNTKITRPIAELISREVEKKLQEKEGPYITAEVISELVRTKLEELSLIEKRAFKHSRKIQNGKILKTIEPLTVRLPVARIGIKPVYSRPSKVNLNWSEESIRIFSSLLPESPVSYLEDLSHFAAQADKNYSATVEVETTAIHFYNSLASLDFLPGSFLFRSDLKAEKISHAIRGIPFYPLKKNIFSTLEKLDKESPHSPITLACCREPDVSSTENLFENLELFLKFLKISLEDRSQKTGLQCRQDLFFSLPHDFSHYLSLLHWLKKEENCPFFSLTLGISEILRDSQCSPESPEQTLLQIFTQYLQRNSSLKIHFLEPSLQDDTTPAVHEKQIPHPLSPGFFYGEEVVPSATLNLSSMIEEEEISWDRLRRSVHRAIHFLDNMIDLISYPNEVSENISKSNRSVALGVMGWADLLYLLRIPYKSDEALDLGSRIAQFVQQESILASSELAKTRGVFPNYIGSTWQKRGILMRHAHLTSLLWDPFPASIAQVAVGLEPHSIVVDCKQNAQGKSEYLVHPFLAAVARQRGFSTEKIFRKIVQAGSLEEVDEIPEDVRKVFVNAKNIPWEWHLRTAHAFEKHFDRGVAKLCPLANLETGHLGEVFQKARDLRLKSLFIKRPEKFVRVREEVTELTWLADLKETPVQETLSADLFNDITVALPTASIPAQEPSPPSLPSHHDL